VENGDLHFRLQKKRIALTNNIYTVVEISLATHPYFVLLYVKVIKNQHFNL